MPEVSKTVFEDWLKTTFGAKFLEDNEELEERNRERGKHPALFDRFDLELAWNAGRSAALENVVEHPATTSGDDGATLPPAEAPMSRGVLQTLPTCAKCGGIYISHPRLGISHLCGVAGPPETTS